MRFSSMYYLKCLRSRLRFVFSICQIIFLSWACTSEFGGNDRRPYYEIKNLVVDSNNSHILFAIAGGGLYKSTTSGNSWRAILVGDISSFVQDNNYPDTIYASSWEFFYKSTNAGESWQSFGITIEAEVLALDPFDHQVLYASGPSGLYRSNNEGLNWTRLRSDQFKDIVFDHTQQGILYIGGEERIFKSINNGASWTRADAGLNGILQVLDIDPLASGTLFCGTTSGLFKSSDGADTWMATNLKIPVLSIAIYQQNPKLLYACDQESLYKSNEGGVSWNKVMIIPSLTHPTFEIGSVKIDPGNSNIIYLTTTESGVLKSEDAGTKWQIKQNGLPQLPEPSWNH